MSTIYLVTSGEYSDYRIEGAFSTEDKANAFAATFERGYGDTRVEDYTLDERTPEQRGYFHVCRISLATGDVDTEYGYWSDKGKPTPDDPFRHVQVSDINYNHAVGGSYKSAEHARKLAVEARQRHLQKASE